MEELGVIDTKAALRSQFGPGGLSKSDRPWAQSLRKQGRLIYTNIFLKVEYIRHMSIVVK
jgi:hypothetical protein